MNGFFGCVGGGRVDEFVGLVVVVGCWCIICCLSGVGKWCRWLCSYLNWVFVFVYWFVEFGVYRFVVCCVYWRYYVLCVGIGGVIVVWVGWIGVLYLFCICIGDVWFLFCLVCYGNCIFDMFFCISFDCCVFVGGVIIDVYVGMLGVVVFVGGYGLVVGSWIDVVGVVE